MTRQKSEAIMVAESEIFMRYILLICYHLRFDFQVLRWELYEEVSGMGGELLERQVVWDAGEEGVDDGHFAIRGQHLLTPM